MFIICQSLPRGIIVKFNLNDFKNSAADVLRKFVVVILLVTSFLYLFSFIGKLHVFAMVYSKRIRLNLPISAFYPHFSVLSPFQFPLSVSVSAIQFQRFIATRIIMLFLPKMQSRSPSMPVRRLRVGIALEKSNCSR
jgi:hypothetical protein